MASSSSSTLFCCCCLFFFFTVAAFISSASGAEYQVGGAVGWRIPAVNETQLYNVWASRRRFFIGDSLHFRYKNDSVVIVEKYGYYHCDSDKPIAFFVDGDTVINLEKSGTMYFISGYADRCKDGVKMMVEVRSPGPVRYSPPTISHPPENPYFSVAPSPAQLLSPGELSPGPSASDSVASFTASVSVTAVVVGLGSWALKM